MKELKNSRKDENYPDNISKFDQNTEKDIVIFTFAVTWSLVKATIYF